MEKEVGNTDVGQLGEVKGVESEDSALKVEEKAVVGSHGPKESEGDEVFEEAVGALIPAIDSEDKVVSDDKNSGEVGDLGSTVDASQDLDNGEEVEKFEEAIGVSGEVLNSREGVEEGEEGVDNVGPSVDAANTVPTEVPDGERESGENAEVLASEVPPVEVAKQAPSEIPNGGRESGDSAEAMVSEEPPVDEQAAPEEVLVNRGEELKVDEIVENGEHELRHADVETSNFIDEDEVNEISDEVFKKPANGVMHDLKADLIQDGIDTDEQGKHVHGLPETWDANEVKGGCTDSGQEVGSNGDIVPQEVISIGVNEVCSTPDNSHKENRNIELENRAASWGSGHQGDSSDAKHGTINSDVDLTEDEIPELERVQRQSLQPENQGNQEMEPENQGNQEKDKDIPAISTPAVIDPQESSTSVINHQGSTTLEDNTYSSVEGTSKQFGVERSPINLKDSSVEVVERGKALVVEESRTSEDALAKEVGKVSVSSESVVESSGGSQPQLPSANGGVTEVLVDQPESKAEKDEEAKQSFLGNRGQDVKPAMDHSSSTVQSAPSPAPAPRPAGLGRAAPLLEPAPRSVQQPRVNGSVSASQNQLVEELTNGETEEYDETREKLQMIRVKFLRLAHRLGQTPHNVVVAQVLYRLGLAEQLRGRNGGRVAAFSFDRASAMAEQLEAAGQEPLDFSCTIMVLGKTGVGKSATINSIFDEVKFGTDAFQFGTKKVQDVVGTVQGIKVRVIDTPGLLPSWSDQRQNERILHSVKRFIKKTPPDIVLYLDRLDMQSRDFGDMPLLRTITEIFGPSIWFNAIVVLTHAASAPPEGPNGTATSYDMFVTQRSHAVQQAIRQAAGDMRLMNPVSLVENHSACRTNRAGQRVLPNGQVWKPHLLLLSFASKILAEANTLLKLQDSPPGRPFATRTRAPPLPFLLSSLLQSRPQVKLPSDQFGDDGSLDDDLDESSDSEDESEYDQLPPFRSLTKAQLAKLPRDQRKAYYAELEYREKLFMKKQLKEDRKRRKMMKTQAIARDLPADYNESAEEESGGAASVPVPMPDLALPATFDSDNPTHRYRCLDSSNQWLVRPVLEPNGWDHDVGYEGINVERLFVVKDKVPFSFSGQVSKDKKDTNLQMEVATSLKHGEGKATSLGFDMQSVGKDIAYTLRGETRLINYRRNKATTGLSVTVLGDTVTGGVKVEDRLIVNKRGLVVVSGGAMFGRGDVAYGGSLEATLRDKDHPLGRFLSTLGLSVMDWHGDLAIGCNSQTQIPIGRYTNLIGRVNINNKGSGQVSIRLNSSEQLQIALIALIPFAKKLLSYSQSQFG